MANFSKCNCDSCNKIRAKREQERVEVDFHFVKAPTGIFRIYYGKE